MTEWAEAFAQSDIEFSRSTSNAPFLPLAFAGYNHYQDSDVKLGDGRSISFTQDTVTQGAVLPFLMTNRDALLVGEWVSWSRMTPESDNRDTLEVMSVGIPVGWFRQRDTNWQLGAFCCRWGIKPTATIHAGAGS